MRAAGATAGQRKVKINNYPVTMATSLAEWQAEEVRAEAERAGVTPSAWLRTIIDNHLNGVEKMSEGGG
jgi:hypothetical protein